MAQSSSRRQSFDPASAPRSQGDVAASPYDPDEADPFGWALIGCYIGFAMRAPGRHKALATFAFLSMVAVAILLNLVMPIRYRVQAVVLAQRSQMSTLSNPGMSREWDVPTRGAREVVVQRQNLVALAKQVNFAERYLESRAPVVRARDWVIARLTGAERKPEDVFDGLVDTLQSRLVLYPGPEGTINISLDWSNRELALDLVQAALQTFLEERRVAEIEAVGEAIAIFQGHDARVQEMIAATVEKVERKTRATRTDAMPRRSHVARPQRQRRTES